MIPDLACNVTEDRSSTLDVRRSWLSLYPAQKLPQIAPNSFPTFFSSPIKLTLQGTLNWEPSFRAERTPSIQSGTRRRFFISPKPVLQLSEVQSLCLLIAKTVGTMERYLV
jgi:hypothetical protein